MPRRSCSPRPPSPPAWAPPRARTPSRPRPPPVAVPPPAGRSADESRFEAIERRLRDLELQLAEVAPARRPGLPKTDVDPDTLIKIRPRFDNALVEKVFVQLGQSVKEGDPLLVIRSGELALAKNECRTSFVQWDHDRKYLAAREPLMKENRITQIVWTETVNDEKKSRLAYLLSRERLASYGMAADQVDRLVEGLGDALKRPIEANRNMEDITRMTVTSPIDGVIISRNVVPGNFYDKADALFLITPAKP